MDVEMAYIRVPRNSEIGGDEDQSCFSMPCLAIEGECSFGLLHLIDEMRAQRRNERCMIPQALMASG